MRTQFRLILRDGGVLLGVSVAPVLIAVEAGLRFGWDAIIGDHGLFVGMTGFGASAPAKDLYKHFGITAEAVADLVMTRHNH